MAVDRDALAALLDPAAQLRRERRLLLRAHHVESEPDPLDAGDLADVLDDLVLEARPQRAAGDGERDRHGDVTAVDLDFPDHVQLGDRTPQLGVDHVLERLQDLVAGRLHRIEPSRTSHRDRHAGRRLGEDRRMTWAGLVLKNLLRRKMRTLLTVAGVAIGVGLIVALLSITAGVKKTASDLIHVGRSDFGLFQTGASDLTRSLLPESLAANVRATLRRLEGRADLPAHRRGGEERLLDPARLRARRVPRAASGDPLRAPAARRRGARRRRRRQDLPPPRRRARPRAASAPSRIAGIFHGGDQFIDRSVVLPLEDGAGDRAAAERGDDASA